MIVHMGGRASGATNSVQQDTIDLDGTSLYHVKGVEQSDTRAVQVDEYARCLNSRDCFILFTNYKIYMWAGDGSNKMEQSTALEIVQVLQDTEDLRGLPDNERSLDVIEEGEEPDDFWTHFKLGREPYPQLKEEDCANLQEARFFLFTNSSGRLDIHELLDFSQVLH
jgi:hypothetical protein